MRCASVTSQPKNIVFTTFTAFLMSLHLNKGYKNISSVDYQEGNGDPAISVVAARGPGGVYKAR